jgi:hypothetical protein
MKARLIILMTVAVLTAGGALAHGNHDAPAPAGIAKPGTLIPEAAAAVRIRIEEREGYRWFESDGLPDHPTGAFPNRGNPNRVQAQSYRLRVPLQPVKAAQMHSLPHQPFGIALNGVLFDPLTVEYWNNDPRSGWNYEAMSGRINLGLDQHNAHVRPNGAYHYHGVPAGLVDRLAQPGRPTLLGYAADGFPIYGPQGHRVPDDPGSPLVTLRPSWQLKSGTRPNGPGGTYDGTYVADFEYIAGVGDLDACNGREGVTADYPAGTYYYVITASFPFVPRCFVGTPDPSFRPPPPPGGAGGGPGGPPGPPGRPPVPFGAPPR